MKKVKLPNNITQELMALPEHGMGYQKVLVDLHNGITLYGMRNPNKILDELIRAFDIMFLDDDAMDKHHYEPEKYKDVDLWMETMDKYGYVQDGKVVVPEREEADYLPYPPREPKGGGDGEELPF